MVAISFARGWIAMHRGGQGTIHLSQHPLLSLTNSRSSFSQAFVYTFPKCLAVNNHLATTTTPPHAPP